jgi:hypothetical protein
MNPNVLRQFLDMYDKQGMGGNVYNGGFDPYGVLDFANKMNGANANGARMAWAERMASQPQQQQQPDYFGADQPPNVLQPYTAPRQFNPNDPANIPPRMNALTRYRS